MLKLKGMMLKYETCLWRKPTYTDILKIVHSWTSVFQYRNSLAQLGLTCFFSVNGAKSKAFIP